MTVRAPGQTSPYRFLKPYRLEDAPLFFGREEETKILLADVIVSRLVVLFARTGTGKTSLINAGVRPHLHKQGYATFFIRVEEDPVRSARAVLTAESPKRLPAKVSFPRQVEGLSKRLGKPLVLFFDQFEEFFLYVAGRDPASARQFVAEVAELYDNEDSGVRLVFSLREEFLGEMDVFRDEIPDIFSADSNLRLRWFDLERAKEAIVGPARAYNVELTSGLVDRLVSDLSETGQAIGGAAETPIEPAQLQIVCDTLWRKDSDGKLSVRDYETLGARGGDDSVAKQVLDQRLEEEFERLDSREEVELLARLLPELHTEHGTKWVREIEGLAGTLDTDYTSLRSLIAKLEQSGLVQVTRRESVELVELVHDYLAERRRVEELSRSVRTMLPRRRIRTALDEGRLLDTAELAEVLDALRDLRLTASEVEVLLRSALSHGLSVEPMLELAERAHVSVTRILAERIDKGTPAEAEAAVNSVIGAPGADRYGYTLVRRALARPDIAPGVVALLGKAETSESVRLLESALRDSNLAGDAQTALARLAGSTTDRRVASRAWNALAKYVQSRLAKPATAPDAIRLLGETYTANAVTLLTRELRGDFAEQAEGALLSLAQSRAPEAVAPARKALIQVAKRAVGGNRATRATVEVLAALDDPLAVQLLEQLLRHPSLGDDAAAALRALHMSTDPQVAAAAQAALDRHTGAAAPKLATTKAAAPPPRAYSDSALEPHLHLLARRILDRGVVPVVGAGASLAGGKNDRESSPPSGRELTVRLAESVAYPRLPEDADLTDVATYVAAALGEGPLYQTLRKMFDRDFEPTPIHDTFARLAASGHIRVLITVTWDDLLERALREAGVTFDTVYYSVRERGFVHITPEGQHVVIHGAGRYIDVNPDIRPVLLRLAGRVDRRSASFDSFVITEDARLESVVVLGSAGRTIPVHVLRTLVQSSFACLGYSGRDWLFYQLARSLEIATPRRSWAVLQHPDAVDERLWSRRGYEVVDMPLDEYAVRLEHAVMATQS